ncbi:unnamed protein product [Pseudo-nitzschia multistriata]|uniref:J domain-containing protein n=1 Tax=Pseudo-nitzschia multistriata TaxID=183589 RepID=A0A448Z8K9_9STRA|nr:unnamed protein product [Pseudo-nitzschia multistriata]
MARFRDLRVGESGCSDDEFFCPQQDRDDLADFELSGGDGGPFDACGGIDLGGSERDSDGGGEGGVIVLDMDDPGGHGDSNREINGDRDNKSNTNTNNNSNSNTNTTCSNNTNSDPNPKVVVASAVGPSGRGPGGTPGWGERTGGAERTVAVAAFDASADPASRSDKGAQGPTERPRTGAGPSPEGRSASEAIHIDDDEHDDEHDHNDGAGGGANDGARAGAADPAGAFGSSTGSRAPAVRSAVADPPSGRRTGKRKPNRGAPGEATRGGGAIRGIPSLAMGMAMASPAEVTDLTADDDFDDDFEVFDLTGERSGGDDGDGDGDGEDAHGCAPGEGIPRSTRNQGPSEGSRGAALPCRGGTAGERPGRPAGGAEAKPPPGGEPGVSRQHPGPEASAHESSSADGAHARTTQPQGLFRDRATGLEAVDAPPGVTDAPASARVEAGDRASNVKRNEDKIASFLEAVHGFPTPQHPYIETTGAGAIECIEIEDDDKGPCEDEDAKRKPERNTFPTPGEAGATARKPLRTTNPRPRFKPQKPHKRAKKTGKDPAAPGEAPPPPERIPPWGDRPRAGPAAEEQPPRPFEDRFVFHPSNNARTKPEDDYRNSFLGMTIEDARKEQERLLERAAARLRIKASFRVASRHGVSRRTQPAARTFGGLVRDVHLRFSNHWTYRNHYSRLGLPPDATESMIKSQYRRLARVYHPDRNIGKADTKHKFQAITEAYNHLIQS